MALLNVSPYISWKGTSTNSVAPSNSRPDLTAAGPPFKAQPINHWRKQLIPNANSGSRNRRAGIGMPMDTPGGSVYLGNVSANTDCLLNAADISATGLKEDIVKGNATCYSKTNCIRRPGTTILSKKYYTDRKSYMRSRCILYDQKLSANPVPEITYFDNAGELLHPTDSASGPQVRQTPNCCPTTLQASASCLTIYKPNNTQYSQQGAVDSSDRITRLKLNTINKNAASYKDIFGSAASRYLGMASTPYFLKSKYEPEPPKCKCPPAEPAPFSCPNVNMDTTGLTRLTDIDDEDDTWEHFPVNFDFYFFGVNYGNGSNNGIFWDTNSVLGFGDGNSGRPWDATDGPGILIGNEDRLNNTFWYSDTLTSSSGASYVRLLYFGRNYYNVGPDNALQYEINIIRDNNFQYVEVRTAGVPFPDEENFNDSPFEYIGKWNITDGNNFQDTCGDFDTTEGGPAVCGSYVFRSDLQGENWEFLRNYQIDK